MRNNTTRRRRPEVRLPGRVATAVVAASTMTPIALLAPAPVIAQQVVADGITLTASGTIDTGTTGGIPGMPLRALNGGTIQGIGPVTLISGGANATGAQALSGGQINIASGSSIATSGTNAAGLQSSNAGSTITADGTAITTSGNDSHGALVSLGGVLMLTGGSVTTTGDNGVGLLALNTAGSMITADGTVITTSGVGSHGALASDAGAVTLINSSITTAGANALGLFVRGGSTLAAAGTSVATTGAGAHGAVTLGGGLTLTDSTVTALGTDASALFAGFTGINTAVITNSTLTSAQDAGINVSGVFGATTLNATVTGSSITGGPAVLEVLAGGTLNLTAGASTLNGSALTEAGGISNVTLTNGSTWNLTGDSNVTSLTNNASSILFAPPGAGGFKTLTVDNYIGAGGLLGFNTFLGADASPTDRLIINGGSATGNSSIRVANAGGPGALTTGDGIPVVVTANGGTTVPGAFALGNVVAAGPFEYLLFRGGATAGSENDWFLRSHLRPTPEPPTPPTPTPPPPSPPPVPLLRPEVAVYAAMPGVMRQAALTMLGTFHERQGEQELLRGSGAGGFPAGWGRTFGQHSKQGFGGSASPEFDGSIVGLQAGQDLYAFESAGGHRDHFGLFAGYTRASGDVSGFALGQPNFAAGRLGIDSTSFGGYWTHIGPTGWYLDAVAMGTLYDTSARSHRGFGLSADGAAFTGSLEAGYPVPLFANLTLEPQAQIVWQHQSLDGGRDVFSTVDFADSDAVTGRIGARLQGRFAIGAALWRPYLNANVWHRFSGSDTLTFAGIHPILTDFRSTALEVGGGIVGKLTAAVDVYATAAYTTNISGNKERSVGGNLGLRVTW
ncbi:autotransporter outer membrane beta-barrel domain-containing protein [Bradyrhizobium sp. LHD-71]|uniref:autotransporter family protein n=1 Tax=Bradyrhizobium sp. LHD-71 TaxID=3072141 RepID=UPI00280FE295|nr:autotransporter outer membrane beta-barrel domain-containing protein [Bradyrhizobium sp. LHD-71]MDQ8732454.1 autotransporter outer membrane beta-barrel domain-containing protein [Bradyrhizobium sp. LHD-71]